MLAVVVNDEIKDILSKRGGKTVTSDEKTAKCRESLLSLLEENRDNSELNWIVDGLQLKNPAWNFDYFVKYIGDTLETVNCYETDNYGQIIFFCRDGEKVKAIIKYDISADGRRKITKIY